MIVLLAGWVFSAEAEELTLCEGTYYSPTLPINGFWADTEGSIGQMIYPADILSDLAGQEITQVKFHTLAYYFINYDDPSQITSEFLINFEGVTLQLSFMIVDFLSFTGPIEGAVPVATAIPYLGADNMTFVLDEPFQYEGGNLLIECKIIEPGAYGTTYFFGSGFETGNNCAYYGLNAYSGWEEGFVDFLPMVTFSYNVIEVPPAPGDANNDGIVNVTDVTVLISAMLNEDYSGINTTNADMNGDGIVNITDVTTLINNVLAMHP